MDLWISALPRLARAGCRTDALAETRWQTGRHAAQLSRHFVYASSLPLLTVYIWNRLYELSVGYH